MRYCEYGHMGKDDKFESGMGDRAYVILDGRNSIHNSIDDAIRFNGVRRPNYSHCQICQGESILRSAPITKIFSLQRRTKCI